VSLLLEALKKAELAKQNAAAQNQKEGAPPSTTASDGASFSFSLQGPPSEPAEPPLITRDRLPDITQPLEILSEDLPSAAIRRDAPSHAAPLLAVEPPPASPVTPPPSPGAGSREARAAAAGVDEQDRASVRHLFEAKAVDYNPRRPFYIVLGVLAVVGVGFAGYLAYQLFGPRPAFYTGPAGGKPPQPIAAAPDPAISRATPPAQIASQAPLSSEPSAPATAAEPAAPQFVAPPPPPARARESTRNIKSAEGKSLSSSAVSGAPDASHALADATGEPQAGPRARTSISVTTPPSRLDPALEQAWEALQSGDLNRAREEYLRALKANPLDRDAQLGLAAIDVRNRDFQSAEAHYLKALEIDPRDPYAQAGVISLRGQLDPVQSESRLKNLLALQPDATFLNFALGNLYSTQNRWPEAQAAYFKAYSVDPENADYAFNLAVSLDHLRQPKLALEYYQRALANATGGRSVGFDRAQTETRIRELQH